MNALLERLSACTRRADLTRRIGEVRQLAGLAIESRGPDAVLGEMCRIRSRDGASEVAAEVVGLRPGTVALMPYGSMQGLAAGCEVEALGEVASVPVGDELLGRVIDGFGCALDGRPDPVCRAMQPLRAEPLNPMQRPRIQKVLETGVRSIDALLTLGQGQRIGIFAGSGVGKSTLLGMVARHVRADINVIALIGERGREVKEFIDSHLGAQGMARSVVVVATSDQPALSRLRAALAALAVAEHFRDRGLQVMLTMDSITRYAMARREVGLAAGEPPTARGYTPSVFAELPQLCERCGTQAGGGAITALFTVLVEGDDHNEPISDLLRATLDGHVVLTRELAQRGHYPAVDVLQSASRLLSDLAPQPVRELALEAQRTLALLERNRSMVEIGAYTAGANEALDRALRLEPALNAFLRQREGGVARDEALRQLTEALQPGGSA
jgi:flagellum-specific ATP synthase